MSESSILSYTLKELLTKNIIKQSDVDRYSKRLKAKEVKEAKEAAHAEVVKKVKEAFEDLTKEGKAVKHRAVWEKVGREKYTRDQVLDALRTLRDRNEARTYKLSNNNFQIFWAQPLPPVDEKESGIDAIPGVDEV